MTSRGFPGPEGVPPDDRIVAPESRAEILEGRLLMSPPADEKHAVPHADLAYVLRAHVKPGFMVAVDMLTRTSTESDFAPDASVFEAERSAETGGRKLEQLAFEIVNEQPLSTQTAKARELAKRGVRRIFCMVTKHRKLLEWSPETDGWSAAPVETVDDACFARPLPAAALLDAATADTAVLKAFRAKGHPELDAVREEGREEGREHGLRFGIRALCDALGLEVGPEQTAMLEKRDARELEELLDRLKSERRWPS